MRPGDVACPKNDVAWECDVVEVHATGWLRVVPRQTHKRSHWLEPKLWQLVQTRPSPG